MRALSPETHTRDWPSATGPLFDLNRLRLIDLSTSHPRWARDQRIFTDRDGRTVFFCRPNHLRAEAIRCLAALTFEGYTVEILGGLADDIRVRIVQQRASNDAR